MPKGGERWFEFSSGVAAHGAGGCPAQGSDDAARCEAYARTVIAEYALGMTWRTALIAAGSVLLAVGTVLVFLACDRHSHSASDTLRPFLITMTPVWLVFILSDRGVAARRLQG